MKTLMLFAFLNAVGLSDTEKQNLKKQVMGFTVPHGSTTQQMIALNSIISIIKNLADDGDVSAKSVLSFPANTITQKRHLVDSYKSAVSSAAHATAVVSSVAKEKLAKQEEEINELRQSSKNTENELKSTKSLLKTIQMEAEKLRVSLKEQIHKAVNGVYQNVISLGNNIKELLFHAWNPEVAGIPNKLEDLKKAIDTISTHVTHVEDDKKIAKLSDYLKYTDKNPDLNEIRNLPIYLKNVMQSIEDTKKYIAEKNISNLLKTVNQLNNSLDACSDVLVEVSNDVLQYLGTDLNDINDQNINNLDIDRLKLFFEYLIKSFSADDKRLNVLERLVGGLGKGKDSGIIDDKLNLTSSANLLLFLAKLANEKIDFSVFKEHLQFFVQQRQNIYNFAIKLRSIPSSQINGEFFDSVEKQDAKDLLKKSFANDQKSLQTTNSKTCKYITDQFDLYELHNVSGELKKSHQEQIVFLRDVKNQKEEFDKTKKQLLSPIEKKLSSKRKWINSVISSIRSTYLLDKKAMEKMKNNTKPEATDPTIKSDTGDRLAEKLQKNTVALINDIIDQDIADEALLETTIKNFAGNSQDIIGSLKQCVNLKEEINKKSRTAVFIEKLINARKNHAKLIESLEVLSSKNIPFEDADPAIKANKEFIKELIEAYKEDKTSYLFLDPETRGNQYLHALKVLSVDNTWHDTKLPADIRNAIEYASKAYIAARDSILSFNDTPNPNAGTLISGFNATDIVPVDNTPDAEGEAGAPPPPPPGLGAAQQPVGIAWKEFGNNTMKKINSKQLTDIKKEQLRKKIVETLLTNFSNCFQTIEAPVLTIENATKIVDDAINN